MQTNCHIAKEQLQRCKQVQNGIHFIERMPDFYDLSYQKEFFGQLHMTRLSDKHSVMLTGEIEEENEKKFMHDLLETIKARGSLYIGVLSIDMDRQGKGFGRTVVEQIKKEENVPIVLYSVSSADGFWEKMGFVSLGHRIFVYEPKNHFHYQ